MQEGFPFKKKIVDRSYVPDYGGDGRYMYILCSGGGWSVAVIDTDLVNSSNWLGDNLWTINPVIQLISLPVSSNYRCILYVSRRKEVWVLNQNNFVAIIDADTNSTTFNTVIRTQTLGLGLIGGQEAACYIERYNAIIRRRGDVRVSEWIQINQDGSSEQISSTQPIQVLTRMHNMSFNNAKNILAGGEYFAGSANNNQQIQRVYSNADIINEAIISDQLGTTQIDEDYIYMNSNNLRIYDINNFSLITTLNTGSRLTRGATFYKIPLFFTDSIFRANCNAQLVNKQTLTVQSTISWDAFRYANQRGIGEFLCGEKNGILLALPSINDTVVRDRVFAYDIVNNIVLGAIDLGTDFGHNSGQQPFNIAGNFPLTCTNRLYT
jgi:hypothetical protein